MDIFPIVCALLGFVLIGASDAKVVTLNLGSSVVRGRKNFYATCNGPCGQVNVTIVSGKPRLFLAEKVVPFLQWNFGADKKSGSIGCTNCLQKVIDVSFTNSSFGLSVIEAKSSDIVKVYGANLKDIEERIFPKKTVNFGTLKHQGEGIAKFTCKGSCKQVLVYATGSTKWVDWYFQLKRPVRGTGLGGTCGANCVCLRSLYLPRPDTCKFQSIASSSFYVLVRVYGTVHNTILTVEASNLDIGLDKSTKIPLPSKPLNLGSSVVRERKNFYGTCNGPCSQVTVKAVSGKPLLFLAKEVIPFLQWSGGSVGCTNCLKIVIDVSFKNSSSFGLSVLKTKSSDRVNVYGANLKDIEERIFPSKILNLTSSRVRERKNFNVTCNGPCREVNVIGISGNPRLHLAENSIPFLELIGGYSGKVECKNCIKEGNLVSFANSSSFGISVISTTSSDIVKVEAANLNDIEEIFFPSKTVYIGDFGAWEFKKFQFKCNGHCKQLYLVGTATPKEPQWFVAKTDYFDSWACNVCVCKRTRSWYKNSCRQVSFDSDSFVVIFYGNNVKSKNNILFVQASNLDV